MFETINFIKIVVVLVVPFYFMLTDNARGVIFWVGLTIGVEILNIQLIANLSPLDVMGLLSVMFVFKLLKSVIAVRIGKILLLYLGLLGVLMLVYGYIMPWPDLTGVRPWAQRAEGRSLIFFLRTISHTSLVIYIAYLVVQDEKNITRLLRYILIGTTISAVGVLGSYLFNIDLFAVFTPNARSWNAELIGRVRGLNGEPRVSAQVAAWGLLLLVGLRNFGWWRVPLLSIHVAAFILTISATGLIILTVGLFVMIWLTPSNLARRFKLSAGLITCLLVVSLFGANFVSRWSEHLNPRLVERRIVYDPIHFGEALANRLEVFDASAVLFFWDNPIYLIFGTGPGLISIPASQYIPSHAVAIYRDRIDSIPHMGIIQVVANSGFVGLILWLNLIMLAWRTLHDKYLIESKSHVWHEALVFFLVFSASQVLQARMIWYLLLGVALSVAIGKVMPAKIIAMQKFDKRKARNIDYA